MLNNFRDLKKVSKFLRHKIIENLRGILKEKGENIYYISKIEYKTEINGNIKEERIYLYINGYYQTETFYGSLLSIYYKNNSLVWCNLI